MFTLKNNQLTVFCTLALVVVVGCEKKPTERKNYFKRDEFQQSSSFRLPQHMNFQELKVEKARLIKEGNQLIAITFLGQMIKKCTDPVELEKLRLEFADMLYAVKKCAEAAIEYQLYAQLYPGSDRAAYADFQAIKALQCEILSADRDQERTQDVITAAKKFAQKAAVRTDYVRYVLEVEKIAQECVKRLCESEILHFYFNLNHNQLKAAAARIVWIKENYCSCTTAADVLELEYRFARASGDEKTAHAKLQELATKFPNHKIVARKERSYAVPF